MRKFILDHALLPEGWATDVAIDVGNGRISAIRPGAEPSGRERIAGIALPGVASLHSHSFQRAMAGLAETRGPASDNFWSWRQVMYRFLGALEPDDVEAIAAFAFMEMLEGGFSRVGEFHYLHHDRDGRPYANLAEHCERIAAAAAETGIGLTLLPSLYSHSNFGGLPPTEGQRRFINDPPRFLTLVEGARRAVRSLPAAGIGVAPHSLRAVSPEGLKAVLEAAPTCPVHMHVSEQTREVDDCLAWCGRRPVEWLLDATEVDARWCLIHATHMTDDEARALAATGAVAGLCPITEANLGDGVFNATVYLPAGGRFGIGTDSNVEITAAGELRQLEYSQRLAFRARNVLAQREGDSIGAGLYRAAAVGGARALAHGAGRLAPGEPADFVVLDRSHPDLAHVAGDRWLDAYVFCAGKAAIDRVIVAGVTQVEGGRHRRHDAIARRYRATMARLAAA